MSIQGRTNKNWTETLIKSGWFKNNAKRQNLSSFKITKISINNRMSTSKLSLIKFFFILSKVTFKPPAKSSKLLIRKFQYTEKDFADNPLWAQQFPRSVMPMHSQSILKKTFPIPMKLRSSLSPKAIKFWMKTFKLFKWSKTKRLPMTKIPPNWNLRNCGNLTTKTSKYPS